MDHFLACSSGIGAKDSASNRYAFPVLCHLVCSVRSKCPVSVIFAPTDPSDSFKSSSTRQALPSSYLNLRLLRWVVAIGPQSGTLIERSLSDLSAMMIWTFSRSVSVFACSKVLQNRRLWPIPCTTPQLGKSAKSSHLGTRIHNWRKST